MAKNSIPTDFTAFPVVTGEAIKLTWSMTSRTAVGSFGYVLGTSYPDWSGRLVLVKRLYGTAKSINDPNAVILFDKTFANPDSVDELYFIDDGAAYDGSGSPEPLDPSIDWSIVGKGLMGGPRYYYTLFSFGIDGEVVVDSNLSNQSAYAYASWGHYNWLRKKFPTAYLQLDKTGDLKKLLETVGVSFDSLKTDIDRLKYLAEIEYLDEDLLEVFEASNNWPSDYNIDPICRRKEDALIRTRVSKKGRLDNFLDIVEYCYGIRPVVIKGFTNTAFINSKHSPKFKPYIVNNITYDFYGDYGYGYDYEWGYHIDYEYLPSGTWNDSGFAEFLFGGSALVFDLFGEVSGYGYSYEQEYGYDWEWEDLGPQQTTEITLHPDSNPPIWDDYYKGHGLKIFTDPEQGASIYSYDGATKKLILDRQVNLTTDDFCQIMICTPRYGDWLSVDNLEQKFFDGTYLFGNIQSLDAPYGSHSLLARYVSDDAQDDLLLGQSIEKFKLMFPKFMPFSNQARLYIEPYVLEETLSLSVVEKAALLAQFSNHTMYLAVGKQLYNLKDVSGDVVSDPNITQLEDEFIRYRLTSSDFVYLDGSGEETTTPTDLIEVRYLVKPTEDDFVIGEYGLFSDATDEENSGTLLAYKHLPTRIIKGEHDVFYITIQLTL